MSRRSVTEMEALSRMIDLADEGARKATAGREPEAIAELLFEVEEDEEARTCRAAQVGLEGDGETIGQVIELLGAAMQPEFVLLGAPARVAIARDGSPPGEGPTGWAYVVTAWQAGVPGPCIMVGRSLDHGETFRLTRAELVDASWMTPEVGCWPRRRVEIRDLAEEEARTVAERELPLLVEEPSGVVGIGIARRVFEAFGELAFGGASLDPRDAPDDPRELADLGKSDVVVSRVFEGLGPEDFQTVVGFGHCACLLVFDADTLTGDDDSLSAVQSAMRMGIEPEELAGVASDGPATREAALFIRDRAKPSETVPGFRHVCSWAHEDGAWREVDGAVVVRDEVGEELPGAPS